MGLFLFTENRKRRRFLSSRLPFFTEKEIRWVTGIFWEACSHAAFSANRSGISSWRKGRAVVFVRDEVASFLVDQTAKIGKVGVRISAGAQTPYPVAHRFEPLSFVVASARLDCLVAALAGMSREKAVSCVSAGLVTLNHQEETSPSCRVEEGSKLSVRGKGKFIIDRLGPLTKKGRLCVSGRKYI